MSLLQPICARTLPTPFIHNTWRIEFPPLQHRRSPLGIRTANNILYIINKLNYKRISLNLIILKISKCYRNKCVYVIYILDRDPRLGSI